MAKRFVLMKIVPIFAFVRSMLGVSLAQLIRGLFYLPLTIWRRFIFVPVTGDPEQGSDSESGRRFIYGHMSKTCLS